MVKRGIAILAPLQGQAWRPHAEALRPSRRLTRSVATVFHRQRWLGPGTANRASAGARPSEVRQRLPIGSSR